MSNIVSFSSARKSFRDKALSYVFHYTKPGTLINNQGQAVQSMVDTGVTVTLIPDENMERIGRKKLDKVMIEKFNKLNGGERTSFRMVAPE